MYIVLCYYSAGSVISLQTIDPFAASNKIFEVYNKSSKKISAMEIRKFSRRVQHIDEIKEKGVLVGAFMARRGKILQAYAPDYCFLECTGLLSIRPIAGRYRLIGMPIKKSDPPVQFGKDVESKTEAEILKSYFDNPNYKPYFLKRYKEVKIVTNMEDILPHLDHFEKGLRAAVGFDESGFINFRG